MCIRALDYCPPVDITFGEYLRALITADTDLVPNDKLGYRIAFIEAFRNRGIYPQRRQASFARQPDLGGAAICRCGSANVRQGARRRCRPTGI